MKQITLGRDGPPVPNLGLGLMGMSGTYGPADDGDSIDTIRAAIDAGVTFLDTGDFYGMGHNEMLLGEAIRGRRAEVFISVKFGMLRGPSGPPLGYDARPAAVKTFLAHTLTRLRTDHVDLYQPARVDKAVPIEETVGAIAELIEAGYVRHVGLSEASAATIRRAHAVHPVAALQTEYSLASRKIETTTLPAMEELGVGLVAYGVLCRGLLGGHVTAETAYPLSDIRHRAPRFHAEHREHNLGLVAALTKIAGDAGLTPAQLALGWALARRGDTVALIGTRGRAHLDDAVRAAATPLGADVVAAIEAAIPAGAFRGERYNEQHMKAVEE